MARERQRRGGGGGYLYTEFSSPENVLGAFHSREAMRGMMAGTVNVGGGGGEGQGSCKGMKRW